MSLFELVVISISLAMDAFTVSMMYGISMPKGNIKKQSFIAFYFGFFQALMPFRISFRMCIFKRYKPMIIISLLYFNDYCWYQYVKRCFSKEETTIKF